MKNEVEALARAIATNSFYDFIDIVCPEFKIAAHHIQMIEKIERAINTPNAKLFIACPPRHSKSYLVSNLLSAYAMSTRRNCHVVVGSYSSELSLELGRRTKILFDSDLYKKIFQDISISHDSSSKTRFHLSNGSSFFSVGIGGSLVGKSASILVIDDCYSGLDQARSRLYQETLRTWYQGSFFTRRFPGAPIIIINTTWTEADLPLQLIQQEPGEWEVLKLPAIQDDGSALWPEMFPIKELEKIKRSIGSSMFEALYQQRPTALEGGIIKRNWIKTYVHPPQYLDRVITSWDTSFKETSSGSYVVGQVWGARGADRHLLAQSRKRMDFPDTIRAIQELSAKYSKSQAHLIEDKANGPAIISALQKHISGIIPIKADTSKEARLSAVAPQFEAGNVYVPDPAMNPWVQEWIDELCTFPNGAHDDQCDATSQALEYLRSAGGVGSLFVVKY